MNGLGNITCFSLTKKMEDASTLRILSICGLTSARWGFKLSSGEFFLFICIFTVGSAFTCIALKVPNCFLSKWQPCVCSFLRCFWASRTSLTFFRTAFNGSWLAWKGDLASHGRSSVPCFLSCIITIISIGWFALSTRIRISFSCWRSASDCCEGLCLAWIPWI